MGRICCSLAGALLATVSTTCAAQSASFYGEIDSGLGYVSNLGGHTQYRATSGLIDGSYWGLQGSEGLGGGNTAIFRLERGFSVTTSADFIDHPYYVGLNSEAYGTLTLGHQYDLIHDYLAPFMLTGGTGGTAFAHPFDNDNANNTYLARNSVKFASPSFDGASFGGMYAFSNGAGAFANNRAYSIGTRYQGAAFSAGAAWLHIKGRSNTAVGAYDSVALPASDSDVFDANVQTQNTYGAGASYTTGSFTFGGAWSRTTYSGVINADSDDAAPSAAFSNYEVNGIYQVTSAVALAGMYTYTKGSSAHWHQAALQATYALSKLTDTYVETIYQRASSDAPAVINTNDPSSSHNQLLIATGIRHHF